MLWLMLGCVRVFGLYMLGCCSGDGGVVIVVTEFSSPRWRCQNISEPLQGFRKPRQVSPTPHSPTTKHPHAPQIYIFERKHAKNTGGLTLSPATIINVGTNLLSHKAPPGFDAYMCSAWLSFVVKHWDL